MPVAHASVSGQSVVTHSSSCVDRSLSTEQDTNAASAHTHRKKQVPFGVLGMIGLVVVIECFVGRNWLDFSDPVSLSWRFSAEAARTDAGHSQVLLLGDSLIKHGLVPSLIEKESGIHTWNLSAARAPILMTYFLFRRALEAGARPDAIVINAKPAVLIGDAEFNARYFQEVLTLREWLELFQINRKSSLMISMLAGRLIPSLRCRLEIRSSVLSALRGETNPLRDINRTLWRNWTVNSGANIANLDSRFEDQATQEVARRMQTGIFHLDRMNAEAIERLFQLASARKIPVFWLLTPLTPSLQALRDQSGSESAYERLLRATQARFPEVLTILDARRANYPPAFFVDYTHLNGRGAIELSRAVAPVLKVKLDRADERASPRWIALKRSVEYPNLVNHVLEDVEHSRRIVALAKSPN